MKKLIVLTICLSMFSSLSLFGQKKFVKLAEKDNVTISYRWKAFKTPEKTEAYKLVLSLKNANDYAVEVNMEAGYYWDTQLKASSDEMVYCLKAKKAILGDMKKSGFDTSDFTFDDLTSDRFDLQLNSIEIKKVENCNKK